MPGRDEQFRDAVRGNAQRLHDPGLGKWLHVEDREGNPYDIFMRDISGKDEFDFMQQMNGVPVGLCDIFLKGEVTLVCVAGLIWSQRRRYERKLTVHDVMKTVSMETVETMELHNPEEDAEVLSELAPDDPQRKLAEMRAVRADPAQGLPGFDGRTETSGPASEPATA